MTSSALNATGSFASMTVGDLARSLHFYVDGLGFEIVDRNEVDGVMRFAMLKSGSVMLGLGRRLKASTTSIDDCHFLGHSPCVVSKGFEDELACHRT